jgi:uroporphyrinogen-III synthase
LIGKRVVITRPEGQAEDLARALRAAGADVVAIPAVEIAALPPSVALDDALRDLERFDLVVFVSANAVGAVAARCAALRVAGLPSVTLAAAPGPGTAAALRTAGARRVVAPAVRLDSEGLLEALDSADFAPRDVLILRGDDGAGDAARGSGREWLEAALAARGARILTLACYRRVAPAHDAARVAAWTRAGPADALVVTSSLALRNLPVMLGPAGMAWLAAAPVFANHARVSAAALAVGLRAALVCPPGDAGIVRAVAEHLAGGG